MMAACDAEPSRGVRVAGWLAATCLLAACGHDNDRSRAVAPDARGFSPVTAPVAPTQAASPANEAGIVAASFAGRYTGTLPCADCPGIDETLVLSADGGFTLTDVYRGRPDATADLRGRWRLDAAGSRIHLLPDNHRQAERQFAIDGRDTLTLLGMDGLRPATDHNTSLVRTPADGG